jgi:hypothetical protein
LVVRAIANDTVLRLPTEDLRIDADVAAAAAR